MTRSTFSPLRWMGLALASSLGWHALTGPALAQESILTLREAIAEATRSHPSIEATQWGVMQAQAATREAWSGLKPTMTLGGGLQHAPTSGLHRPQLQVSAVQPLYDGDRTRLAVRVAELSEASAELERVMVRRRIAYETARAYFSVLQAESLLEAARNNVEQAKEQLALAELRAKGQVGTRMEVLQAAGAIASAQDGYLQAVNQVRQARETLENLLGRSLGNQDLNRTSVLKHLAFTPQETERALDARPEIGQVMLQRDVQEVTAELRARATWPTLSAVGDVAMELGSARQMLTASLSWPFIDGERTAAQVAQARLAAARAEATLAALKREVSLEIRLAAEALRTAQDRVRVAQEGLQAAIDGLMLAKVRFAGGVGTGLEVINALSVLSQAQSTYIQGTYAVLQNQLRLGQALGVDVEDLLP